MKTISRLTTIYLILICSFIQINHCVAKTNSTITTTSEEEKSLKQFVQTWSGNRTIEYISAFQNLNTNGKPEAIVYLTSNQWCGSGGCTTLILSQEHNSWKIITKITVTRLPIRMLSKTSHKWHNLGIWVQGGGIQPGYEAELIFNGKTYPKNPTILPARHLKRAMKGTILIPLQIYQTNK